MSFLAELKRRRVVRVAIVYGAVAFAVLQAADILAPALHLPLWTMTLVVLLLLLGLPLALVLSWAFELTPEGLKRTADAPAAATRAGTAASSWLSVRSVLLAFLLVGAGLAAGWFMRPGATLALDDKSIAVLPFDNLSPDADHAYFADGMHEEILTALQRNPELRVISRTSVLAYRDSTLAITEIARRLGVSMILEGSVRRVQNRARITAQLIDARTDRHLWAESFDRTLDDVFSVQAEVAERIATSMQAQLTRGEADALRRAPTTNPEAYQFYLRALSYSNLNLRDARARLAMLEEALRLDPDFGLAHLERYHALVTLARGYYDQDAERNAPAALERGVELLPDAAETARARGTAAHLRGDLSTALPLLESARARMPSDVRTATTLIDARLQSGEAEPALALAEALCDVDPMSATAHHWRGRALMQLRRFAAADSAYVRAIQLDPSPFYFFARIRAARARGAPLSAIRALVDEGVRATSDADMLTAITRASGADVRMIERARPGTFASVALAAGVDSVDYFHTRGLIAEEHGDLKAARAYADSARALMVRQLAAWERGERGLLRHPVIAAWVHTDLGLPLATLGEVEEARLHASRALELLRGYAGGYAGAGGDAAGARENIARIYVRLRMYDEAVEIIEDLITSHGSPRVWFTASPEFEPMRDHPRYRQLMAR